jgi:hypothetical protein
MKTKAVKKKKVSNVQRKSPAVTTPKTNGVDLYEVLKTRAAGTGSGGKGAGFWKPTKPGEHVEGLVLRIDQGNYDDDVILLRLPDDSLIRVGAGRSTVLHRILFDECRVSVGGFLAVIYDGPKLNKKGGSYKSWRCAFNPPAADDDNIPEFESPSSAKAAK